MSSGFYAWQYLLIRIHHRQQGQQPDRTMIGVERNQKATALSEYG
jgi:hypothetical protein